MTVYGVMADLHAHNWSSFATLDSEGRNSRLMDIIREIHRCCAEVRNRGGNRVVIAGDVFHTRGAIKPSVFNPLRDALYQETFDEGMMFNIIPGNHDLESRDSRKLTSAVGMLEAREITHVTHSPLDFSIGSSSRIALIPWEPDTEVLLKKANDLAHREITDLIIHAGIDGVLSGMPPHGLSPADLAALGFRRVFAGHYHNHRDMGMGVYSIGAPTHQTWSDVGTRAGWLVVDDKEVRFFASHAPNFIDISGHESEEDLPLIVDGHFIRARCEDASPAKVEALRESLIEMGAKGVLVQSVPTATAGLRMSGLSVSSLNSLDQTIADYCTSRGLSSEVGKACNDLLKEVQS